MRILSMSVAAALVTGVCVAAPAQAGCTPIHDPGSACPSSFLITLTGELPGADAVLRGKFHEGTAVVMRTGVPSYVKDTADDGLDVYAWVKYRTFATGNGGRIVETPIGSASGNGVTTTLEWISPDTDVIEEFWGRVCIGPGTTQCSRWVG